MSSRRNRNDDAKRKADFEAHLKKFESMYIDSLRLLGFIRFGLI